MRVALINLIEFIKSPKLLTLDYLLHGISWGTVQRMIVDAPGAEEEDTKPGTTEVVLTEENAGEVLDLINKLNR